MNKDCTIVIPIKNGIVFLPDLFSTLEKFMRQGFRVVIVEDHSSDGTFEILIDFAKRHSQLSLFLNPGSGICDALNFGIKQCESKWIARMDADDLYDEKRLIIQLNSASQNDAVIFSDYIIFENDPKVGHRIPCAVESTATVISLVKNRRTPHPVAFINREMFIKVGGYKSEAFPAEDVDLWFRLATVGNLRGLPEPLLKYRRHSNSITHTQRMHVKRKHNHSIIEPDNLKLLQVSLSQIKLRQICRSYKGYDQSALRVFLLLLDIYHCRKALHQYRTVSNLTNFLWNVLNHPRSIFGGIQALRIALQH